MEKEQSLQTIEQALNLASTKGAFTLQEAAIIFTALSKIKEELTTTTNLVEIKKGK